MDSNAVEDGKSGIGCRIQQHRIREFCLSEE